MEKSYRGVMHGAGSFALALVPKELVALGLLMLLTVIGCALLLWTCSRRLWTLNLYGLHQLLHIS